MKKIIITALYIISLLALQLTFAQENRAGSNSSASFIDDGNLNPQTEFTVSGFTKGFANKVGENTYWVKNAVFNISENKVVDFGLYLKLNHAEVIDQVPAVNGYVVEVNAKTLNIWIASETGTPASDEIEIMYNE